MILDLPVEWGEDKTGIGFEIAEKLKTVEVLKTYRQVTLPIDNIMWLLTNTTLRFAEIT